MELVVEFSPVVVELEVFGPSLADRHPLPFDLRTTWAMVRPGRRPSALQGQQEAHVRLVLWRTGLVGHRERAEAERDRGLVPRVDEPIHGSHAAAAEVVEHSLYNRRGVPAALVPALDCRDHEVAVAVDHVADLVYEQVVGDDTDELAFFLGDKDDPIMLGCGRIADPAPQAVHDLRDLAKKWFGGVTEVERLERWRVLGSRLPEDHLERVTVCFALPLGCQRSPADVCLVRR